MFPKHCEVGVGWFETHNPSICEIRSEMPRDKLTSLEGAHWGLFSLAFCLPS